MILMSQQSGSRLDLNGNEIDTTLNDSYCLSSLSAGKYADLGISYFESALSLNEQANQSDNPIILTENDVDIGIFSDMMRFVDSCHKDNITSYHEFKLKQIDLCDITMLHQYTKVYDFLQLSGNAGKWFIYGFVKCLKSTDHETLAEVFEDCKNIFSAEKHSKNNG